MARGQRLKYPHLRQTRVLESQYLHKLNVSASQPEARLLGWVIDQTNNNCESFVDVREAEQFWASPGGAGSADLSGEFEMTGLMRRSFVPTRR